MTVSNANLSSRTYREVPQPAGQTTGGSTNASDVGLAAGSGVASSDDTHLSELVRSLRWLVGDSPERQARIEQIARSYVNGAYQVDPQATASKIIDAAFQHGAGSRVPPLPTGID